MPAPHSRAENHARQVHRSGEPLSVRVLHYEEAPDGKVVCDVMVAEVERDNMELGLSRGATVNVRMSLHPDNHNRLLHDLIRGDSLAGTVACGTGSEITFTGCSVTGGGIVEASAFTVDQAVEPASTFGM